MTSSSSSSSSGSASSADASHTTVSSDSDSQSQNDSEEEETTVARGREAASSSKGVSAVASDEEPGQGDQDGDVSDQSSVPGRPLGGLLQTTEEHLEQHGYPAHIKDCERCRYVHNRRKWEEDATFPHPKTGLPIVWLVEQPKPLRLPWHLGCLVCMKTKTPGLFGRCKAGAKLSNIRRHGESPRHLAALQKYAAAVDVEVKTTEPDAGQLTFAHILFQRTLLKRGGSFESFSDFCKTAKLSGAALGHGSIGPQVSRQLTSTMASREGEATARLLAAATTGGIVQDGLGSHLSSRLRLVVWKWPRGVQLEALRGVQSMGSGDRGPWLVDRVAAVGELESDHSAEAKRILVREAVAKNCHTGEAFTHAQKILRFFATDAAPDEMEAGLKLYRGDFPNLVFQNTDPSHGCTVALKAAIIADSECAAVDRLLVSGKNPASLSKLLRTSTRLQSFMKEAERDEGVQILSHFGFAPQRFDSRKVPLGRIAVRLRQVFEILAAEAEGGEKDRKAAAQLILQEMTGENTWRLVLGGMMADLCHEHSKLVHSSDFAASDPLHIEKAEKMFLARLLVLFGEGLILTKTAANTFTGQVLKFLSSSKLLFLKKKALVLSLGELAANDELYMPLNRMRLICQAIRRMLEATRPAYCWGKQFVAFALPSPLDAEDHDQSRKTAEKQLTAIAEAAKLDAGSVIAELRKLAPAAKAHFQSCRDERKAWGRASFDFPEYAHAREAVSLCIGFTECTTQVERDLKQVPLQESKQRAALLNPTLEEVMITNIMAPDVDEMCERTKNSAGEVVTKPITQYLPDIVKRYHAKFGFKLARKARKKRRDAGIAKDGEAIKEFLRDREAAIGRMCKASGEERKKMLAQPTLKVPIPSHDDAVLDGLKTDAYAQFEKRAGKTENRKRKHHDAIHNPEEVKLKKPKAVVGHEKRWGEVPKEKVERPTPGVALVADESSRAAGILHKSGFKVVSLGSDPETGVANFLKVAHKMSTRRAVTHLVLCQGMLSGDKGLFGVAARLASAFLCKEAALLKLPANGPTGIQFKCDLKKKRLVYVHSDLYGEIPGLEALLKCAAELPGSGLKVVRGISKLEQEFTEYKTKRGARSRPQLHMRAFMPQALHKKYIALYGLCSERDDFWEFLCDGVDREAVCPGQ
ncbi:unnamed protein product [Symbiodinium sp. CCMP2592]|nr:unnamed protein product [Symbiodinium sp. CCMP2592]